MDHPRASDPTRQELEAEARELYQSRPRITPEQHRWREAVRKSAPDYYAAWQAAMARATEVTKECNILTEICDDAERHKASMTYQLRGRLTRQKDELDKQVRAHLRLSAGWFTLMQEDPAQYLYERLCLASDAELAKRVAHFVATHGPACTRMIIAELGSMERNKDREPITRLPQWHAVVFDMWSRDIERGVNEVAAFNPRQVTFMSSLNEQTKPAPHGSACAVASASPPARSHTSLSDTTHPVQQ